MPMRPVSASSETSSLPTGSRSHGRTRLATLCTLALQGALIQARVERSGAPIEITADELARTLGTSLQRTGRTLNGPSRSRRRLLFGLG